MLSLSKLKFVKHLKMALRCNASSSVTSSASTSVSQNNPPKSCNDDDAPIPLNANPYEREKRKCLLCKHDIELDYKNARLLQQFVSNFSGRVYDRYTDFLFSLSWLLQFFLSSGFIK
ncbi:hypothetical protein AB6A40_008487 [Gnathostoma spinigerum]|uniref:Uncharacterized protein n=1 Tax=Gnathostoma spinigerum TaxID=75299 RepID=A0ABD6EXH8_9BILA